MIAGLVRSGLPIDEILPELRAVLRRQRNAVVEAPPGAGKSTVVPIALLEEPWLRGGKIIMLEPRRLATRAVATRMAATLGESVGETVGYRMRLGDTSRQAHAHRSGHRGRVHAHVAERSGARRRRRGAVRRIPRTQPARRHRAGVRARFAGKPRARAAAAGDVGDARRRGGREVVRRRAGGHRRRGACFRSKSSMPAPACRCCRAAAIRPSSPWCA